MFLVSDNLFSTFWLRGYLRRSVHDFGVGFNKSRSFSYYQRNICKHAWKTLNTPNKTRLSIVQPHIFCSKICDHLFQYFTKIIKFSTPGAVTKIRCLIFSGIAIPPNFL